MHPSQRPKSSVRLVAVGDVSPGDCNIVGFGVCRMTKRFGSAFPFEKIREELGGSELLIGNLEGVLTNEVYRRDLRLAGLPEMARTLRELGFEVLSLANNHSFDHGRKVLEETIQHLESAGIKICGLRGQGPYYSKPVILNRNGLTIGILGYNWIGLEDPGDWGNYVAIVEDGVVNYTWNRDAVADEKHRQRLESRNTRVLADIRRLREEVDCVVLMPHWSYEWTTLPPYGVTLEARCFLENGVDLIAGSHPHVVQGVERQGDGLVAYSLGNFLFDAVTREWKFGMVLRCDLEAHRVGDFALSFVKRGNRFQVLPATEEETAENLAVIEHSSHAISSPDACRVLDDDKLYREYERQYNALKRTMILFLLLNVWREPLLLKPIWGKIKNLCSILWMRLRGKKVRW
jgi:poly-gamma-glutamate synthesis protein (capsule biosynthesis protein)